MMHKTWRIMLVDDDEITNFLSKETLRLYQPGLVIYTMHNGKDAFDFLLENQQEPDKLPNIILLDINMPVMDGWEFLTEFENSRLRLFEKIQVYMFTSSVYYEDINKAKSFRSVKNIYSKPLDEAKIREIIPVIQK